MEAENTPANFARRRPSEGQQFRANGISNRLPDLEKIYAGIQNSYHNFPVMHPVLKMPMESRLDKQEQDIMTSWRPPYHPNLNLYHPDAALASLLYSGGCSHLGFNDKGMRRNATRETTATLKSWLNEHRKNPYPTKAEKIMLAIISKMTLTQVSTWFANARRRLKKENRMTWLPRNPSKDESDEDQVQITEEKDSNPADERVHNYFARTRHDVTGVATSSVHPEPRPFPVTSQPTLAEKYQKELQLYATSRASQQNCRFVAQSRRRDSVTSPSTSAGSRDRSPSPRAAFVCLPGHAHSSLKETRPKEFPTRKKSPAEEKEDSGSRSSKKQGIWSPIDVRTPQSVSTKRSSLDGAAEAQKMSRERQGSFPGYHEARHTSHSNHGAPDRLFFPPSNDAYMMMPQARQQQMAMAWVCLEEYNRKLLANRGRDVMGSNLGRPHVYPDVPRADEGLKGALSIDETSRSTDSEDANCNIPMNLSKSEVGGESEIADRDESRRPFDSKDRKQRICSIVAN